MVVRTFIRKTINIGGFELGVSVTSEVSPSPIIRENENYIWTILGKDRKAWEEAYEEAYTFHK